MWEIRNRTPFKTAGAFERDTNGQEVWCVAVRASFDIGPQSALRIAEDQQDVRVAPEYLPGDGAELAAEQDIVAFATATDLLITGTIGAPAKPVSNWPLKLARDGQIKTAELTGTRIARKGLLGWKVEEHSPVADTLISWRHCYGGTLEPHHPEWHPANPIGTGMQMQLGAGGERGAEIMLPRIHHPGTDIMSWGADTTPIGFGPIARNWTPRVGYAGTYDAKWEAERSPLLPRDFNPLFFNTAPPDQIVPDFLHGGETIALDGFFTTGPVQFKIPQLILTARTLFRNQPIDTRFTMLRAEVDLDSRQLRLVYTTKVACNGDDAGIAYSTVRLKQMTGVAV
ncbi:DUF2169 domain-containing protein [Yoonia sp. SS1-5]|uniref:DUF2169 domain-containing protein n=1 Tax=Yoonia rhodophyticola TaxID=3137370 RepID=A0AAN0NJZ5_9RHOB